MRVRSIGLDGRLDDLLLASGLTNATRDGRAAMVTSPGALAVTAVHPSGVAEMQTSGLEVCHIREWCSRTIVVPARRTCRVNVSTPIELTRPAPLANGPGCETAHNCQCAS